MSIEKKEARAERIANLHLELVKSIYKKIPDLRENSEIYLQKLYFLRLTDEEFVVLWSMPNLVIRVDNKAAIYIEERRKLLGLLRDTHSGVVDKNNST